MAARANLGFWLQKIFLSLSIVLIGLAGWGAKTTLEQYIRQPDEILSYNAVVWAAEEGVPRKGAPPGARFHDPNAEYPVYQAHVVVS